MKNFIKQVLKTALALPIIMILAAGPASAVTINAPGGVIPPGTVIGPDDTFNPFPPPIKDNKNKKKDKKKN